MLTLVDKPVTYKLFPGLTTSPGSRLLERLLPLDLDLDLRSLVGEGDRDRLRILLGGGVRERDIDLPSLACDILKVERDLMRKKLDFFSFFKRN